MPTKLNYFTDADEIDISKVIIHVLDPPRRNKKTNRGFFPSEVELDLIGNSEVKDFFVHHISSSLKNPLGRMGKFKNVNADETSGISAGILDNSIDFIDGSIKIAKIMFDIMSDGRTKEADLAVVLYTVSNFANINFLAILKIDPSQAFQREFLNQNGKNLVSYKIIDYALTNQKLQKCAFIQPITMDRHPDYDMLLLEPKTKDIAQYFKDKLLNSEESYDSTKRTKELWNSFIRSGNYILQKYGMEKAQEFQQQRDAAMKRTEINYEELINSLDIPEQGKSAVNDIFKEKLPDRQFEIDQDYVSKFTKKRKFEGRFGLRVQIDNDNYDTIIEVGEAIVENGKIVGYKVVLNAYDWKEVTR